MIFTGLKSLVWNRFVSLDKLRSYLIENSEEINQILNATKENTETLKRSKFDDSK
jgi:hypothetical protein